MKRKLMAVLLLLALLLPVLPQSAAARTEGGYQLQYLYEPKFNGELEAFEDRYVSFYDDNGTLTVYDLHGNRVYEAYNQPFFIDDEFYLQRQTNGELYALFRKGVRMSEYSYVGSTEYEDWEYTIRLEKPDMTFDFYDLSGKKVRLPQVPSGWVIYDIANFECALVRRPKAGPLEPGCQFVYNMCDWNGKLLREGRHDTKIEKITEKLVRVPYSVGNYYTSKYESMEKDGDCLDVIFSPTRKYLAMMGREKYWIYDMDMNLLSTHSGVPRVNTGIEVFAFLTDEKILTKKADGSFAVADIHGKELLRLEAGTVKIIDRSQFSTQIPNGGFVLKTDNSYRYYNEELKLCLDLSDKAFAACADNVFVTDAGDNGRAYYDADGNLMFTSDASEKYLICDGVILKEKNERYAVCDRKGIPTTDYVYAGYNPTGVFGVINLYYGSSVCAYDLWSLDGQKLNEESFEEFVRTRDDQTIATYKQKGKFGAIRIVTPDMPTFMDAPRGQWYYDAVEYCAEKGLFAGTSACTFSPDNAMTRAMLVSVLWRLDGKPAPEGTASFADVQRGAWYADAVCWAAENEIVFGVGDGKFAPDDNITREQIAAIMLRYAKKKGYDTQEKTDISSFADSSRVSSYAVEAIQWANAAGILSGSKEGSQVLLLPQNNATRAQLASILMRFVKNIA